MKHIHGTKVNYPNLLRHRKNPIKKPNHIMNWLLKQKDANRKKLEFLHKKQDGKCVYCQRIVIMKDPTERSSGRMHATIDHILPKAFGGTDSLRNMVMACSKCNALRGLMPVEDFRKILTLNYSNSKIRHIAAAYNPYPKDTKKPISAERQARIDAAKNDPILQNYIKINRDRRRELNHRRKVRRKMLAANA